MKVSDLKELLIRSLDKESDAEAISGKIENAGAVLRFSEGFQSKVLEKIFSSGSAVIRKVEFARNMNYVFYRIALTGVAAIVLLLISIFMMEGSLSLDSFLGLGGGDDESILCLLTGN
ncbi:MAG: hypothetical protein A2V46_07520 [Bacteroidetes bacterium RBG_19FT_COMBO_42_7]|jgi:hypothetical protein|nr:MAG: hypothetical protein A2V46_07520 [Bacteroidetes bacterium RBG_19FT_COMBO_42_7]